MTEDELLQLAPFFQAGETYLNGTLIEWNSVNFATMRHLRQLRFVLGAPVILIRGAHPKRPEAVDACCPSLSLARVAMDLMRVQECSWGLYSGNSFHLDTRPFRGFPSRWLAVKEDEEGLLAQFGFEELITNRADGWIYLAWSHERALDALVLVCRLAEGKRGAE